MADKVSQDVRSAMMSAVKGRNTSPERLVRSRVFAKGFRYRIHNKNMPGSPDLSFPRYRVAVFVHGCFWHGHDCPRGRKPQSNVEFWTRKLEGNVARDKKVMAALQEQGWTVVVIWTCEIEKGVRALLNRLQQRRARYYRRELAKYRA